MGERKPMQVPTSVWERLKRRAEQEGKPMTQLLLELVEQMPDAEPPKPEHRECVFCGIEVPLGRRICDQCFYDPSIVRPQIMGALYYVWALQMSDLDPTLPTDFETFAKSANREWAMDCGVSETEWNTWVEWLIWRQKFKQGIATIDDLEWRQFCLSAMENGHTGSLASWKTIIFLFGQKVKRRW